MSTATKSSYKSALHEIVERYRAAGQPWPTDRRTIAAWAYHEKLWKPPHKSAVDELAKDLGRAMRTEVMVDPQGRVIRRKYARRVEVEDMDGEKKQMTLWDDITTASPEHMQISFQQRRNMTRADCFHHKQEVDSYNDNWNDGKSLKFSYDFTEDLEEMAMPTEYPFTNTNEEDGSDDSHEDLLL
jgi:hypothetical protein